MQVCSSSCAMQQQQAQARARPKERIEATYDQIQVQSASCAFPHAAKATLAMSSVVRMVCSGRPGPSTVLVDHARPHPAYQSHLVRLCPPWLLLLLSRCSGR